MSLPILDLSLADDPSSRAHLLEQLRASLFDIGFLYVENHGVEQSRVSALTDLLPKLFDLPDASKLRVSKLNSPHFLGYNGFAEETTLGKRDLREQFDYATELPVIWEQEKSEVDGEGRDYSQLFWRLRGPNQWPSEREIPGFRRALTELASFCCVFHGPVYSAP
jgi:isopenicillin N synthase-like dioxygenase